MFKKFLAALGTLALAAGMALAVAPAASATNTNDPDYWESLPGEICNDVGYTTEDSTAHPYVLPGAPSGREWSRVIVKAGSTGHSVTNENAEYTTGLIAGEDFVHPEKDSISHVIVCSIPLVDSVDCSVITFIKGSALDGSNYINLTIIQGGQSFQMNAEINEVQAQDSDVAGPSGLYVLVKAPGGDVKYPLTVAERDSGVFRYDYSNYLTGKYTVDWIQYDSHNLHFEGELTCGEDVADAAASVTLNPPSCNADGSLILHTPTWADWQTTTVPAVGAYTVIAKAQTGHTFPADTTAGVTISDAGKTKTFEGTILPKDDEAADCDEYEVALYLYQKKDPTLPASWQNSLKQTFIASHKGTAWFTAFPTGLPDYVCGPAWGVQQDKVGNWAAEWDDNGDFIWPTNIEYPNDNIGWPPIYEAKHDDLSTVITVPACETPTGEPSFEVKTCQQGSQNLVTLAAVEGGEWEIEQNGVVAEHDSYTGTPAGYDAYTIRLVDKDPSDQYDVTTKTWTYTAVDPSMLKCVTAEDPTWAEQLCNPLGVGFTTASYTITPATGVRYEISLDDGTTFTDATPTGSDPVTTDVTTFPTKVIIKAFALPTYELVGTSEFSHIFLASTDDCIDKDASATIQYVQPTCFAPGAIDVAKSTLVNATWQGALPTAPGDHTVVAEAAAGHAFSNGALTKSFPLTILPKKTTGCDLPSLGLLTPTATVNPPTCSSGATYTLGGLEGAQFNWTVNGAAQTVPNGTYPALANGADVVLIADPVGETDGLQDWTNPTTLSFDDLPPATCDLTTLALTGTGVSVQLTIGSALIALAGLGLTAAARRMREAA